MNSVFHTIKQNPGNRTLIQVWNKLKRSWIQNSILEDQNQKLWNV